MAKLWASVRAELIHRAVENVVRNAVKYTEPGTTVEVRAEAGAGDPVFVVRVADRGPGVPKRTWRRSSSPSIGVRGARGRVSAWALRSPGARSRRTAAA